MARSAQELMWVEAITVVARADRLQRQFFHPTPPGWEPPVDLVETADSLILTVALPGARAADVDLVFGGGEVSVVGVCRPPSLRSPAYIHRLELPHGRFERRVKLPPGRYELTSHELEDGCLTVIMRKLG